jgi:hypothetical protein
MMELAGTLRPRGILELLDAAVRLYRRDFFKLTSIVAVAMLPIIVLQIIGALLAATPLLVSPTTDAFSPLLSVSMLGSVLAQTGSSLLTFFLINGVAAAALTRALADHVLGQPAGLWATFRNIGNQWVQLFVLIILLYVLSLGLGIWFIVPCVGWFTGGGMLSFFSAAIVPLVMPVVLIERKTATQAIQRAWELARARFWPILGLNVVLGMLQQAVSVGPVLLLAALYLWALRTAVTSDNFGLVSASQTIFQSLTLVLTSLFFVPLHMACTLSLYFDLRVRGEGLDLAVRADAGQTPLAETLANTPPVRGPWFRSDDWRNFVLFSLIIVGLIVVVLALYFLLIFGLTAIVPSD